VHLVALHRALQLMLGNILKAIDGTYDNASRISQGSYVDASDPALFVQIVNDRFGVSSGGMNSPSRLSSRNEPQKRCAGSRSRGDCPSQAGRLTIHAQDMSIVFQTGRHTTRGGALDSLLRCSRRAPWEVSVCIDWPRKRSFLFLSGSRHLFARYAGTLAGPFRLVTTSPEDAVRRTTHGLSMA